MKKKLIFFAFLLLGICSLKAQELDITSSEIWIKGISSYGYLRFFNNGTLLYDKTSGAPDGNAFHINVASNQSQGLKITKNWASPAAFCVYSDGTAYLKTIAVTSDSRLKDNILPIESQILNLKKIQGVSYTWKNNDGKGTKGNKRTFGLLAQDLEKIYPDLVFTDEEGTKSIYYIELIPILISSIKEQQSVIEDMQKRLDVLEKKNK
jgi:hypothetical protein